MESQAGLKAVFRPKSVAVIGASTAPGKLGHDILANLKNGGFPGPLYPVNPKAEEILGRKVDMITEGALNRFLRPRIQYDLKTIYEG